MKIYPISLAMVTLVASLGINRAHAQGMPSAMHDNIHALLGANSKITRKVEITKTGYVATTESADPKLATILREHVSQMRERLQSGGMVRRWDPAFPELVEHYDDISHRVEITEKGLRITVTGKTPDAIKVALNHAKIVSDFASNGWKAHDTLHPRVLPGSPENGPATKAYSPGCKECENPLKTKPECPACKKEGTQTSAVQPCCKNQTPKKAPTQTP
jgi:hypothetical protein